MITDRLCDLQSDVIVYEPSKDFTPNRTNIAKMSASHLILMQGSLNQAQFNKLCLQKAAYFLNVFSGTNYFKFEEYKFGPYAHSIDILSGEIKTFEECHRVNTAAAWDILYRNQISNTVKATIEKYSTPILKAASFVNSIQSNHELEIVATIVAIVRCHSHPNDDEIVNYFFKWPKYDKTRFTNDEIRLATNRLVKSSVITSELLGYEVNNTLVASNSTMPKYVM